MIPALTTLYVVLGVLLTVYTGGTLLLLVLFLLTRKHSNATPPLTHYPPVTVQLPIYNERWVVERLLEAVANLNYPREHLIIQVLDDSTDETTAIIARCVTRLRSQGLTAQHIRRAQRTGYKAGALAHGMACSPTPFYAIFDADFIPPPNFLQRTLPHLLADDHLGMVQGRWGHLNPFQNALTAAQTLAIDAHFAVEQTTRSRAGLLLNFNGTGGVWRATCIRAAGGWQATTLTEDLDLSYRAQMCGWRLRTLPELVVPGELPARLAAFKRQQFRWAKGSTQCLGHLVGRVWRARALTWAQCVMGTLHLCQYMPYPLLLLLGLLAPPLMLAGAFDEMRMSFLLFSGIVPPLAYGVGQWALHPTDWWQRLWAFPALIVFGTGITISNTLAILSAWFSSGGAFERTPKFGASSSAVGYTLSQDATVYLELLMAAYIGWGTWVAVHHAPHAAPYLALSAVAYGAFALWGLVEQWHVHYMRRNTVRKRRGHSCR